MIKLCLDWHEVLWWLKGGMSGSHLCWGVYEDMVNLVWPQCSEQERIAIFQIIRRDFGTYWRPEEWNGYRDAEKPITADDGPWREDIFSKSEWMLFRQMLACYNPENQYKVTMRIRNKKDWNLASLFRSRLLYLPAAPVTKNGEKWDSVTAEVRAYLWEGEYRMSWDNRCDESMIEMIEKIKITKE